MYRAIWLRALRDHLDAFGVAYEEASETPVEKTAERLRAMTEENLSLGAFLDGRLVGIVSLHRAPWLKVRHKAHLGNMYVAPAARRQGVGQALLSEGIARARALPEVEALYLAVTVGNEAARRLYLTAGFQPHSIEPRYLKVADQYYAIEWLVLFL